MSNLTGQELALSQAVSASGSQLSAAQLEMRRPVIRVGVRILVLPNRWTMNPSQKASWAICASIESFNLDAFFVIRL